MQVIHVATVEELRWELARAVVGMGTLDGVHVGHQAILRHVGERAAAEGGCRRFSPSPNTLWRSSGRPRRPRCSRRCRLNWRCWPGWGRRASW